MLVGMDINNLSEQARNGLRVMATQESVLALVVELVEAMDDDDKVMMVGLASDPQSSESGDAGVRVLAGRVKGRAALLDELLSLLRVV
jgi:hypothetical protein